MKLSKLLKRSIHIYAVKTVEQAIEILTGYEMGYREENGLYPQNTVINLYQHFSVRKNMMK
jgi:predicted ATP-dependent protease